MAQLQLNAASLTSQAQAILPPQPSEIAETSGVHHHAQLMFSFYVDIGSHYVAQAGLELLCSSNPPASASQSAGITGMKALHLANFFFNLPHKANSELP